MAASNSPSSLRFHQGNWGMFLGENLRCLCGKTILNVHVLLAPPTVLGT